MRVLFIHNSLPEYRFEFWRQLKKRVNMDILVTHSGLERKIYGLVDKNSGFCETYWNIHSWRIIISELDNYDIVILPPTDSLLDFLICLYVLILCKIKKTRTILWSETWIRKQQLLSPVKALKIIVGTIMKIIIGNGVDRLIVPGKKAFDYLTGLPIYKVTHKTYVAVDSSTSPIPAEQHDIRKRYEIPVSARLILFMGRMIGVKGLDVLIEAANEIVTKHDAYLIVGGDGPERDYCESLVSKSAKNRIIFIGKISPSVRRSYYEQSDVFVIPSRLSHGCIDIWALTVNEALECGTPVISTTDVGASYDLIDEENGRIAVANDCNALKIALEEVLFERKLYLRREHIANKYMNNYSINNMVEGFLAVFNSF